MSGREAIVCIFNLDATLSFECRCPLGMCLSLPLPLSFHVYLYIDPQTLHTFTLIEEREMDLAVQGESGSSRGGGEQGFGPLSEEGVDNDSIFGSLNFDPQLFMNDLRNAVDDVIEEGFNFFKDRAPKDLRVVEDADISNNLAEGIDAVQNVVRLKLDKQLDIWEKYCLLHCFAIPEGLALPEMKNIKGSIFGSSYADRSSYMDLDTQLESLREKLVAAGRESAGFHRELSVLERQTAVSTQYAEALNEALRPLEENSTHDVMKAEILKTTSELHEKMEKLNTERREKMENLRLEMIRNPNQIHTNKKEIQGFEASLEDLPQFLDNFKVMNQI